jgi:hypothetical protein
MVSEAAARAFAATGAWADPWLWASAAAFFAGLAVGQLLRSFVRIGEGANARRPKQPGRVARAICFLSLGLLALAGLLVLSNASLLAGAGFRATVAWLGLVFALALLFGLRPIVAGLPLVLAMTAGLFLMRLGLEGWTPLGPARGGAGAIVATILPYDVGPASFRGHIELGGSSARSSVEIALASSSCALSVECLQMRSGPGLLAEIELGLQGAFSPNGSGPRADVAPYPPRFYRVTGIAAPGGLVQAFAKPPHIGLLDFALLLPAHGGLEPGGVPVSRSVFFGAVTRMRATSSALPLLALEPTSFRLYLDGHVQ